MSDSMLPIAVRVASVSAETHDTRTLITEPVNGDALPTFAPGQFKDGRR